MNSIHELMHEINCYGPYYRGFGESKKEFYDRIFEKCLFIELMIRCGIDLSEDENGVLMGRNCNQPCGKHHGYFIDESIARLESRSSLSIGH